MQAITIIVASLGTLSIANTVVAVIASWRRNDGSRIAVEIKNQDGTTLKFTQDELQHSGRLQELVTEIKEERREAGGAHGSQPKPA